MVELPSTAVTMQIPSTLLISAPLLSAVVWSWLHRRRNRSNRGLIEANEGADTITVAAGGALTVGGAGLDTIVSTTLVTAQPALMVVRMLTKFSSEPRLL